MGEVQLKREKGADNIQDTVKQQWRFTILFSASNNDNKIVFMKKQSLNIDTQKKWISDIYKITAT